MALTQEQKLQLANLKMQKDLVEVFRSSQITNKGDKGETGAMPSHKWNGTELSFELPDGTWSKPIDLKGDKGDKGENGINGKNGKDAELSQDFKNEVIETIKDSLLSDIGYLEDKYETLEKGHKTVAEKLDELKKEFDDSPKYDEEKAKSEILKILPKYPPQNAGGSGATFLKSLRDVNLSGLSKDSQGKYMLGSGSGSSGWSLTGNAGTTAGTNFVGTTDNVDLVFKRNSIEAFRIPTGSTSADTLLKVAGSTSFQLLDNSGNTFLQLTGTDLNLIRGGGASQITIGATNIDITPDTAVTISSSKELRFVNGANYVGFKPGTLSGNTIWTLPTTDSTGTQALVSNGSGVMSWSSFGDVTAASTFGTDNRLIRSDGTGKGVQSSGVTLSDTDSLSGIVNITSTGQFLGGDGTVSAPTYSFSGDTDTGFYRSGSTLRYADEGIERIRITSNGHISVNANATGIATSNGVFHGTYDADTNSQDGIVTIDTYSTTGYTTTIGGRRARGTAASPSQIMAGDKIVEFIGKGWHGGGDFAASNRALMGFYANEDWNSSTANGTYITLNTTTDATGANHQSLLIDDEGNVSLDTATTNVTTTIFPSTWASTSAKHFVIRSGGTNRDTGLFIRNGDDTAGLNIWNDTSAREVSYDSMVDHASSKHIFRLRTLGTALTPLTLDVNGALLGVGSNLRLQGATSGTATIVAPTAAGTPTLTLPTVSGTFLTSADKISAHAATTSAELAGVISDETGSGSLVFATSPTLVTPILGTFAATAGTITNTITNYNGIATAGNGLASVVATGGETGRTSALAATTIFAVPASKGGMYMVCVNANVTRGATTSSILGNVDVTFTSPTDSIAKTIMDGNSNFVNRTAGNTTGDGISYTFSVYAKASTNIQLAIGYTSSGATTMEYEYRYSVIYLG